MDHIVNIARGETQRGVKQRQWAIPTCSCGWEGIEFGSDRPNGWLSFMQCTVRAAAWQQAKQHRSDHGYIDHPLEG